MDHLHTVLLNRKRGAAKAAATWRAKKSLEEPVHVTSQATTFCGGCGKVYVEGSAVIFMTSGAVEYVRTCRHHLLLITIFVKNVVDVFIVHNVYHIIIIMTLNVTTIHKTWTRLMVD